MRARDYGLASMLGSIPSTLVLVSVGAAVGRLGDLDARADRSPAEWALVALGVFATIALLWLLRRMARDALADLPGIGPEPGPAGAGTSGASGSAEPDPVEAPIAGAGEELGSPR